MKNQCEALCPGCRKHCPAESPCCKYGRAYFKKQGKKAENAAHHKKHKWEKYVMQGGLAWKMLLVSCKMKKALRKGRVSEEKLFGMLDEMEKGRFLYALDRMNACLKD